ncbi:EamA family transporter [Lichenicoccus sp.]|uniref:DMT family transporter n=1 Tax=Lichenicoccus sp. TaxID=2781899 RepID=UPI003D0F00AC
MDRSGILPALLAALLFGAATPAAKLLLDRTDPWTLAGLLYLGAGIGLWLLRLFRRNGTEAPLRRAELPWLGLVIGFGGVLGPVLLMAGLARTDAASASLLLNLEGLATMAIAWLVFHENVDRRLLLGAFAILAGAAVLSWSGTGVALLRPGTLLIAATCLAWGIDNNLTQKLSGSDPMQIAMLKGLVAGLVNLVLAFGLRGAVLPHATLVLAAAAIGFVGYGLSLALFVVALRHLGTARTSAYFCLAPFAGGVLALAAGQASLSTPLLVAGVLMALGVWLHVAERHEHDHTHDALTHAHRHRHDSHHQHEHPPGLSPDEPHSHVHRHAAIRHRHAHYPDQHHRHSHPGQP